MPLFFHKLGYFSPSSRSLSPPPHGVDPRGSLDYVRLFPPLYCRLVPFLLYPLSIFFERISPLYEASFQFLHLVLSFPFRGATPLNTYTPLFVPDDSPPYARFLLRLSIFPNLFFFSAEKACFFPPLTPPPALDTRSSSV